MDGRRRGRRGRGQPPSLDLPVRLVRLRRRRRADRGRQRGPLEAVLRGFELDPETPGMATNPSAWTTASGSSAGPGAFALYLHRRAAREARPNRRAGGRIRTIREVYEWEQTQSQGLLIDVDHATLGTITLPGPPLRFFDRRRRTRPSPAHRPAGARRRQRPDRGDGGRRNGDDPPRRLRVVALADPRRGNPGTRHRRR